MIQPIGDRVLVEQLEKAIAASSLVFTGDSEDALRIPKGKVLVIGTGKNVKKAGIVVGDLVLFTEYAGERTTEESEKSKLLLLNLSDILAIENE